MVGDIVLTFAHLALDFLRPPALCIPPPLELGSCLLPPCGPWLSPVAPALPLLTCLTPVSPSVIAWQV